MRTQWDEKVAKALKKKNQETEYAAMSEDKGRHSWSAAHPAYMGTSSATGDCYMAVEAHPAYMGTSLCPDPRCRGEKER